MVKLNAIPKWSYWMPLQIGQVEYDKAKKWEGVPGEKVKEKRWWEGVGSEKRLWWDV